MNNAVRKDRLFDDEINAYKSLQPRQDRLPCSDCPSSDGVSIYLNRSKRGNWCYQSICFSCGERTLQNKFKQKGYDTYVNLGDLKPSTEDRDFFNLNSDLEVEEIEVIVENKSFKKDIPLMDGYAPDITYRGIREETFEKYNVSFRFDDLAHPDIPTHIIYPYFSKEDEVIAQKIRIVEKPKQDGGIHITGMISKASMFGMNLFKPGGKYLLITEGEPDCLSAFQMLGGKYPCISVKNGCEALTNEIKKFYQYINSFEQVRVCMDPDAPGNEAIRKLCDAGILEYGKLKLVKLNPLIGDVNTYLTDGKQEEFVRAFWNAQDYQPEGVVLSGNMLDTCLTPPDIKSFAYPFDTLQNETFGQRFSEFDNYAARSGIGKTSILKEFTVQNLIETNEKVGLVLFEEPNLKTLRSLVGMQLKKRIDIPGVTCSKDEFIHAWEQLGLHENRIALWDVQVNSWDLNAILKHIEFMIAAQDVKFLYIDFLQCIRLEDGSSDWKDLDKIAETLANLAVKKNVHISSTSQLNRTSGEIRGSSGIEQFSHKIVYLERDKKHKDERMRRVTKLTIDKNRFNGTTGPAGFLEFNVDTGRLVEQFDIDDDTFEGKTKENK